LPEKKYGLKAGLGLERKLVWKRTAFGKRYFEDKKGWVRQDFGSRSGSALDPHFWSSWIRIRIFVVPGFGYESACRSGSKVFFYYFHVKKHYFLGKTQALDSDPQIFQTKDEDPDRQILQTLYLKTHEMDADLKPWGQKTGNWVSEKI